MENSKLTRIYIRAKDLDGKWGSYNLKELIDRGSASTVFTWALSRLCGYEEGAKITEENVSKLVDLLPEGSYVMFKKDFDGHPCTGTCCDKCETKTPDHECSDEAICEGCYGLECVNCGATCYCEL